jgi:3-dehydroquinate synthase
LGSHVRTLLGAGASCVHTSLPVIDLGLVMDKFDHDKKHHPGSYRIIVPCGDGGLELISVPKNDKVRRDIVSAFEAALGQIPWPFSRPQRAALAS